MSGYNIQRASLGASVTANLSNCNLNATAPATDSSGNPAGTSFTSVGALTVTAGATGSFTNYDLANGGYCYRVMVQDPNTGQQSVSNYMPVNIPGVPDVTQPTSTSTVLTASGTFAKTSSLFVPKVSTAVLAAWRKTRGSATSGSPVTM